MTQGWGGCVGEPGYGWRKKKEFEPRKGNRNSSLPRCVAVYPGCATEHQHIVRVPGAQPEKLFQRVLTEEGKCW